MPLKYLTDNDKIINSINLLKKVDIYYKELIDELKLYYNSSLLEDFKHLSYLFLLDDINIDKTKYKENTQELIDSFFFHDSLNLDNKQTRQEKRKPYLDKINNLFINVLNKKSFENSLDYLNAIIFISNFKTFNNIKQDNDKYFASLNKSIKDVIISDRLMRSAQIYYDSFVSDLKEINLDIVKDYFILPKLNKGFNALSRSLIYGKDLSNFELENPGKIEININQDIIEAAKIKLTIKNLESNESNDLNGIKNNLFQNIIKKGSNEEKTIRSLLNNTYLSKIIYIDQKSLYSLVPKDIINSENNSLISEAESLILFKSLVDKKNIDIVHLNSLEDIVYSTITTIDIKGEVKEKTNIFNRLFKESVSKIDNKDLRYKEIYSDIEHEIKINNPNIEFKTYDLNLMLTNHKQINVNELKNDNNLINGPTFDNLKIEKEKSIKK